MNDLPQNANRYKRVFDVGLYRRNVWQYMFGGLLRSIFGVYSPHRYWDRIRDDALSAQLKKEYTETKRKGLYGIYTFKTLKTVQIKGVRWRASAPPAADRGDSLYILPMNRVIYVRVNRMEDEDIADLEFVPERSLHLPLAEETLIFRIRYKSLQWLVANKKIRRLPDGKIYELKSKRRNESDQKEAIDSSRRLHRLRKVSLSVQKEPEGRLPHHPL